jgi:hypothetical protein
MIMNWLQRSLKGPSMRYKNNVGQFWQERGGKQAWIGQNCSSVSGLQNWQETVDPVLVNANARTRNRLAWQDKLARSC